MPELMASAASELDGIRSWFPPEGLLPRGTVVVLPGRGEHGGLYERFGRRLAADAYVVHALDVTPDQDPDSVVHAVARATESATAPVVLAGSDTGALHALVAAAGGALSPSGVIVAGPSATGSRTEPGTAVGYWTEELAARTACPTHQNRLTVDERFARGRLDEPVPTLLAEAFDALDLSRLDLPVLVLHGGADRVTPPRFARDLAARLPRAVLGTVREGRHDVLNDATHRSVAAQIVQWLERLRGGPDLPLVLTVEEPTRP